MFSAFPLLLLLRANFKLTELHLSPHPTPVSLFVSDVALLWLRAGLNIQNPTVLILSEWLIVALEFGQ